MNTLYIVCVYIYAWNNNVKRCYEFELEQRGVNGMVLEGKGGKENNAIILWLKNKRHNKKVYCQQWQHWLPSLIFQRNKYKLERNISHALY